MCDIPGILTVSFASGREFRTVVIAETIESALAEAKEFCEAMGATTFSLRYDGEEGVS
jgi:threonine dehydrogenase-like Zn-dependent dehydrogenase